MKTWITWEREGDPPARVELSAEVAEAIERYAAEIGGGAVDVVASLVRGFADEINQRPPPDVEAASAALRGLLAQGPVLISIRSQAPGVDLPSALRSNSVVSLRLGYGLTPPMTDLAIDAAGVRAVLTFNGAPYFCVIPWRAVLTAALEGPPSEPAPRERPKLRLVD